MSWRAVIAHNVLTALKRLALPAELLRERPKRLRFLILNTPGRAAYHVRRMVLRLVTRLERCMLGLGLSASAQKPTIITFDAGGL